MIEQPATQADKRALTQRGKVEERRRDETVSIEFPESRRNLMRVVAESNRWPVGGEALVVYARHRD